jgi:hypothetical protein
MPMRPSPFQIRAALAALGVVLASGLRAAEARWPSETAKQFIETRCASCHDETEKEAGLDLTALMFHPDKTDNFATWVKVFDRVTSGEMPPKKKPRPAPGEVAAFTGALARELTGHEQARTALNGRATRRRLNRYEYENVVRDLLDAPWLQLKSKLPEDPEAHHFNKIGEALDVSHMQMAKYLEVAEFALRDVMARQIAPPATTTTRYYAREQRTFLANTRKFTNEQERMVIPVLGFQSQYELYGRHGNAPMKRDDNDPAQRELTGFVEIASQFPSYYMWFDAFTAPLAGRYKLRFKTFSAWVGPSNSEPGLPTAWWVPDLSNVMPSKRQEPVTVYAETVPHQYRWIGKFDAPREPGVQEMEAWLLKGETIHPDCGRFFRADFLPKRYRNPLATKEGSPGVGFQWLEVEGPIYDRWPSAGHRMLFGDLPLAEVKDADTGKTKIDVVSADPAKDAARLLANFVTAAYRHPPSARDLARFLPVFESARQAGVSFADAMITAYTAVLCSPQFLTVNARPGPLDDHALAERLALFLQNTAPDAELRAVAAQGKLRDAVALRTQTERLLAGAKSAQFVNAFTDYWLELRRVEQVSPDPVLYADQFQDDLLNESALEETRAFVTELIRHDLPVRNVVQSDFVMVNERLATLYGLPWFDSVHLRKVPVPPGSPRGGLLTQASILKVTTNGNHTSPIKRGAWIMDRILGLPPSPPPPNVPAVEADTRGATTIRTQLALHRDNATCASCHKTIDPPGFALENFDVLGGWRDRYRAYDPMVKGVEGFSHIGGQRLEYHYALPVDATGEMADGTPFADVNEFKKILLKDEAQLARNVASQLIVYATGAPVRFSDRAAVEKIIGAARKGDYGFRTLIHEVVQSELFRNK